MDTNELGGVSGEAGPLAELTRSMIGAGIEVQKRLGPWLLESAYEACLTHELELAGHAVERQIAVSIRYRDLVVPNAFRLDLLVDGILEVELKVAEAITKEHEAQVLSYLRFSEKPAGLLMNFALQPLAKRGVRRFPPFLPSFLYVLCVSSVSSVSRIFLFSLLIAATTACGYHRLDRQQRAAAWAKPGETIRLARFRNLTPRLGLEDRFTKALENRLVAASPWRLVAQGESSRWVLQGTLEQYRSRPIGLALGNAGAKASAGSASRVEVAVVASVELLDGQTGVVVLSRRGLTFSNQYRVDQNFASFDSRELQVIENLADDFAESFLTQLLEGID